MTETEGQEVGEGKEINLQLMNRQPENVQHSGLKVAPSWTEESRRERYLRGIYRMRTKIEYDHDQKDGGEKANRTP